MLLKPQSRQTLKLRARAKLSFVGRHIALLRSRRAVRAPRGIQPLHGGTNKFPFNSTEVARWLGVWILCPVLALGTSVRPNAEASGGRASLAQSSTQQQNTQDAATLELSVPVVREITGGQKHAYQIALTSGQHIRVEIKPQGIDLGVSLQLPDGEKRPLYDPIGIVQEQLVVERVAEISGTYQFTIFTRAKASAGRYEIRLAELRVATENDLALQVARKLHAEYTRLTREGRFTEARPLMLRAIKIREQVSGPDDLKVAVVLENLSMSYIQTGDYASAEPLELRVLEIKEKAFAQDSPEWADALRTLGVFYYDKGDHLKAEDLIQKALVVFEKAQQPKSIVIASALSYLGNIHYARSDYGKSESYYRRSLAIREKLLGPDDFHLTESLGAIGSVAYDAGEYAKAEAAFGRALTLSEDHFGSEHTNLTGSLNNLATLYSTKGDYAKAEVFYRRALSIHEREAEIYAPRVQATLHGLARLYAARGLASEAVAFQARASELEERYLGLNLAVGSEREKLAFLSTVSEQTDRTISLNMQSAPGDADAGALAILVLLQRKGRALDAMADTFAALRQRADAQDRILMERLSQSTSQLARLVLNDPQHMSPERHQKAVKELEEKKEKLEGEISRRSAEFRAGLQPITLEAVQAAIPAGAALVEIAAYRPFYPKAKTNRVAYGETRYAAYVLRGQGTPRGVDLGEAKAIDTAVDAWRQALRNPERRDVRRRARAVYKKVMQPVRALVGDAVQLLISPDGQLNLIPFEALVDEQGRYLVERYSFAYLTSGRDLLRLQVARKSKSQPVVLADPAFGEPAVLASRRGVGRSAVASARVRLDKSQLFFGPLPGVGAEVSALKKLLPQATFLTKEQATKAALKRVSGPSILHIATHGFFLQSDSRAGERASAQTKDAARSGKSIARVENPLLRSGLALAGANEGPGGSEDGVLTALETAHLDLWGTKLVVLSACDTGIGEVRNGDGVYGLRRALVLAGAESQLMSLWPVSDRSTHDLMVGYYERLMGGEGRGVALRRAQLQLLQSKHRGHPYYWASFIQTGEWANLKGIR